MFESEHTVFWAWSSGWEAFPINNRPGIPVIRTRVQGEERELEGL